MTRLNTEQQELLDAVASVKVAVDDELNALRAQHDREVDMVRAPLYDVVRRAAIAHVPARRLGMVLGTSDHKTIKSYFPVAVTEA